VPALRWTAVAAPDPDSQYVVMASSLPLRRLTATVRFFRFVQAIRRQLARSDGLLGYALRAKPISKRYWTLSVWRDEAALANFMRSSPHAEIMTKLRPAMDATTFARWTVKGSDARIRWEEALRRLADAANQQPGSAGATGRLG
jgi:quinol monooxygenase YgiN